MVQKGLSMNEIKDFLGLGSTQAMYRWFQGKSLPSVDNSNRRILLYYKKLAQLKAS
jgi:hypothetical protein